MNFFWVGFVLIAVNLNMGWAVNYAIKIIGFLLILGGIYEYSIHDKGIKVLLSKTRLLILINIIATVLVMILNAKAPAVVSNWTAIVLGVGITVFSLDFQRRLIERITRSGSGKIEKHGDGRAVLVPFVPDITKLGKTWCKLALFTCVGTFAEALNRIITNGIVSDCAGFVVTVSKIIVIVFALIFLFYLNQLRNGFNKAMDSVEDDS